MDEYRESGIKNMIKTLRITSIIVAILAGIVFVFPVVFGGRGNKRMEQLLNSPGAIEKFNKAQADKSVTNESQSSPLVKQAQALALYLNPPRSKAELSTPRAVTPSPRGPVTAKFTLIGTSFYAARPELSLAFIDEPGKGLRWVRPASQVGHLIIEQIKDGLVVVRDGQKTFELATEKRPEKSTLLEGLPPGVRQGRSPKPASATITRAGAAISTSRGRDQVGSTPQLSDKQSAVLEKLVEKLRGLQRDIKSHETDSEAPEQLGQERAKFIEKLISDFKATRVNAEEAEKLGDLGKKLKDVRSTSNGSKAEDKKIE
ncbi:MAG: hypothetical protein ACE5NM_01420 [Sedimentisphaerales bacterium]